MIIQTIGSQLEGVFKVPNLYIPLKTVKHHKLRISFHKPKNAWINFGILLGICTGEGQNIVLNNQCIQSAEGTTWKSANVWSSFSMPHFCLYLIVQPNNAMITCEANMKGTTHL